MLQNEKSLQQWGLFCCLALRRRVGAAGCMAMISMPDVPWMKAEGSIHALSRHSSWA